MPAPARLRTLFLAWLGLFLFLCFLLWVSIWFWGMRIRLAPPIGPVYPASAVTRVLPPANHVPVLRLSEVALSDAKLSYVGRAVHFYGVNVLKLSRDMFWIGRNERESLLVVPSEALPLKIKAGNRVAVGGIIFEMLPIPLIEKRWGFGRAEAAEIAAGLVCLRASSIKKL